MAGAFTQVDLSQLPPPDVVETLAYETILAEMLADLQLRDPAFSALVESDPAYKILEVAAFRETLIRQRVNDGARAVMLAYAAGADLDQIGGNYNVARLVIDAGDPSAIPPVPPTYEADDDYRLRIQLSLEGYTSAGSVGAYVFHALSTDGTIKDVSVANPPLLPGRVDVRVLSRNGTGVPDASVLAAVQAALSADDVRPLCDTVIVAAANVVTYSVTATLTVYPGAGQAEVLQAAQNAVTAYTQAQHRMGRDITRSGLFAALHQPGVQNVTLTAPAADIVVQWDGAAYCTGINVTIGGVGE